MAQPHQTQPRADRTRDIATWVLSIGGLGGHDGDDARDRSREAAEAGRMVFEATIKGKLKLTDNA